MAPSFVPNGGIYAAKTAPKSITGRFASVYSEVQNSRVDHALPLPSVLKKPFTIVDGPQSSAAGNPGKSIYYPSRIDSYPLLDLFHFTLKCLLVFACVRADEIAKLFPHLFGQPSATLVPTDDLNAVLPDQKLKIGVVLSGGQAPGGHNVISGIYGKPHFNSIQLYQINQSTLSVLF